MTTVLSGQMTRVFRIENKNLKILQSPQNQSGRGRACTHTIQIQALLTHFCMRYVINKLTQSNETYVPIMSMSSVNVKKLAKKRLCKKGIKILK